jgi:tetratricopeptide (TPR) repeat protein
MGTVTIAPSEESAPGVSPGAPGAHAQNPWIYRPWIDLTVGCGAWSAPLLLAGFYFANSYGRAWSVAFYFLALLANYPHFMATVYRAYHKRDEFEKYRLYTIHVALLLALTGVAAHLWYALLPWIFTLYICWSPWHYTGQNFGLLMMFARRAGVAPTERERAALRVSFVASYILLMLSFHTGASEDPMILSLGLPAKLTLPARASLAVFFLAVSGWAVTSLARRSSLRKVLPVAMLTLTQFLWFLLPAIIELASGREIPQTRYSSGILAVLHSTQYLWITSYYQKKEARAAGNSNWSFGGYLVTLIAGGIALFIPGPWMVSRVFHTDFAASFLTFTALVNIHHFILDGKIWKLRDKRVAALLVEPQERSAVAAQPSNLRQSAAWLTGSAPAARAVRIGAVALLFGWAAVDQVHFWWSNETTNLAALQRAAALNPDDSSLLTRLANAREAAGQKEAAMAAMQDAARLNPAGFAVQESYGRLLIESGRDAEAYAQYQKMVTRWPKNVNALIDYGMLAHRLGHDEEAVDSWQRAVDADPSQANAQLYLAQGLDQERQQQAAARHYRAYLEIVAARHEKGMASAPQILAALIKVADADAAAGQSSDAAKGYSAAMGFAQKAGESTLESLAAAHQAELQEKQGDAEGAAESYQLALRTDANVKDAHSVASDWFNYAQFLKREKQPDRYVLACLLKAEKALQGASGEDVSTVKDAVKTTQQEMGRQAAVVEREFEATAAEALRLQIATTSAKR